jgi:hypothetical protein
VTYDKLRLHRMGYFSRLMSTHEEISDSVRPLLTLCRDHIDRSIRMEQGAAIHFDVKSPSRTCSF